MLQKKGLFALAILSMFMLIFSSTVFASPELQQKPTKTVIYKANEIKDIEKLYDRAKNGVSDVAKEKIKSELTLTDVYGKIKL